MIFHGRWLGYALMSILIAQTLLGVFYSVIIPPWEGYDEPRHYAAARYLREFWLPPQHGQMTPGNPGHLTAQPPLYYYFPALATFWVEEDLAPTPESNPWFRDQTTGGYNRFLHNPPGEAFPYHGTILGLHVARLVSVLMSTLVGGVVYAISRLLLPGRPGVALAAAALAAFSPQLLFMGSIVSNDIGVTLASGLALWCLVYALTRNASWQILLGFWLAFGAAVATKIYGIHLAPLALFSPLIPLYNLLTKRSPRRSYVAATTLSLAFLAAGLSGVPILATVMAESGAIARHALPRLVNAVTRIFQAPINQDIPAGVWYWFKTFWASFGWGNIAADEWVYIVIALVCAAGAAGCLRFVFHSAAPRGERLAIVVLVFSIASLVAFTQLRNWAILGEYEVTYGRYSLPALPIICVLIAAGLAQLGARSVTHVVLSGLVAAQVLFAVVAPFRYILPAYALPPIASEANMSAGFRPVKAEFDRKFVLLGWESQSDTLAPGGDWEVTLYWQGLAQMHENFGLALKLQDATGKVYETRHTHPGTGAWPTSIWQPGEIVVDRYRMSVPPGIPGQMAGYLSVSFFRLPNGETLEVRDPHGTLVDSEVDLGPLRMAGQPPPVPDRALPTSCRLGDRFALAGYRWDGWPEQASGPTRLTLLWQTGATPNDDLKVFVHVVDGGGKIIAQVDDRPRQGRYPTSQWAPGETIVDEYQLPLPAGKAPDGYQIRLGMYYPDSGIRLLVLDGASNQPAPDFVSLIGPQPSLCVGHPAPPIR